LWTGCKFVFVFWLSSFKETMQNNKRTLFVSGLSKEVDHKLLRAAFIPFGEIVEAQVSLDPGTRELLKSDSRHRVI
jgi:RNA recognition motif-containing protein